ncbi:hypothetical protein Tco_0654913 [Tanacetum coccineum]|uniref:TPX2 C-terminal domain-containing protein n=1 Tax=Tanacetum coccineum TaxID=301880 RepID=A0ABQ4X4N7_9ASTR
MMLVCWKSRKLNLNVVEEPVVSVATTTKSIPVSAADLVTTAREEEQIPASTKTFSSSQSQLLQAKNKGKAIMVEPEVPLKKKDQIALDEELALRLHAEEQTELERMQRERVAPRRSLARIN